MFSIADRYNGQHGSETSGTMWPGGDTYFESAKAILASTYSTPRIGTCQALLLLGYREVGIGAMAQAWIYVRMAVTMAQDLGMHKTAEKWRRTGGNMFTRAELQERRRIWYACVVMDKYVSSYIGRPVAISARDFDTELPSEDAVSSFLRYLILSPYESSLPKDGGARGSRVSGSLNRLARNTDDRPQPYHFVFQCCCGTLYVRSLRSVTRSVTQPRSHATAMILSSIVQCIYAIRPEPTRASQFHTLEETLDAWLLDLPEQLRYDPMATRFTGSTGPLPAPNVLTLHMNYWCTVILLHRPFIRHLSSAKG